MESSFGSVDRRVSRRMLLLRVLINQELLVVVGERNFSRSSLNQYFLLCLLFCHLDKAAIEDHRGRVLNRAFIAGVVL
jgi:hypothetical protein